MADDVRRNLPSVDAVLRAVGPRDEPAEVVVESARAVIQRLRAGGGSGPVDLNGVVAQVQGELARLHAPSLRRVINASGVILQTNLGRAPLSQPALAAMESAAGASNLEYDLEAGARGSRHEHVRELIRRATGAADGIAVNNNAAALLMVLQTFAAGREVIVSRGQAVEIGGGFRIPDVLRQSGAHLVEVGTTNRTYARDYEAALTADTAAILRVHTSNFQVIGFTTEPTVRELADVAKRHGVMLFDDLGSGCLVETESYGLAHEPTVQESIRGGADLSMFSGDKLLGGPQAGIIAGRADLIETLRRHPLARALRLDKIAIAGLNATLLSYVLGQQDAEIPIWEMLRLGPAAIRRRAQKWARAAGEAATVREGTTMVGGGSLPGQGVPTWCTELHSPNGADELAARLRRADVPVIGRIEREAVLLDPRTVDPRDDELVARAVTSALTAVLESPNAV
ncbi:MAG: L-seryl-tRNA(Sec) selenium transferase [Dehalococcoidia bacterium]